MYKIYGDYGYTTETLLQETDTRSEAERWVAGYISGGDFGGYTMIEIARFADEEYVVVERYDADDYEDFYEGDDDFALIDEF